MNDKISETQVMSEEEQVALLLENLPSETEMDISVPSRGIPYFGKEGKVRVRPMTFQDEKSMSTGSRSPLFNPANHLLSQCVKNVDVDRLVIIDKLFLLIKVRELSFGSDYKVGVICPNCSYENKLNLELSKLISNQVPEDFSFDKIDIHLEGINKKACLNFLTVADEDYIDPGKVSENLWRFIQSIEGVDNPMVIAKVVERLPLQDVHSIIKAMMLSEYGIQPHVRFTCDSCTKSSLINLPIDENFFSVN
jgi:hypothetical protein|tara:strand:+ start:1155 stop:1907 length:753 start_codon:yes stop_codon:yes gene_type:complete